MDVLRDKRLTLLIRRTVCWLGIYLSTLTPLWRSWQHRYRLKHRWPVPY